MILILLLLLFDDVSERTLRPRGSASCFYDESLKQSSRKLKICFLIIFILLLHVLLRVYISLCYITPVKLVHLFSVKNGFFLCV